MLFDFSIEPCCEYCFNSIALGHDEFACVKHGIMYGHGSCGSFRYEPTKRIPPILPVLDPSDYPDDDFML